MRAECRIVRCRTDPALLCTHHSSTVRNTFCGADFQLISNRETDMNTEQISRAMRQFSGVLTEIWGDLTGDALRSEAGRRIQFAARNELRNAVSSEQSAREMREFLHRNRNWNHPEDSHHA
jgi:uncharacterized protein YjbJ (UPF0337 family)